MRELVKRPMGKLGRTSGNGGEGGVPIGNVRQLSAADLDTARNNRGRDPALKRFRDSHHMIARLMAMGVRNSLIAEQTGYSLARIGMLNNDPAMQELVAHYRGNVDDAWRSEATDYFAIATRNRTMSARMIGDRLEAVDETGDESHLHAIRTLLAVQDSFADRTGFPKRTVATNVNIDFASMLDKAIARSEKAREPKLVEPPDDPSD